ncbi:delta 9-fatty acid desaturase protein [Laetiporus sulphureus 93-53]|uniref:Acyl-CoA desaturase n=1 Tax=Laetiporus sulphureus 93-53 TaxID=1314785 RepID=A0A165CNP3_9APHY|nr:delta 9-fatty acid desaturase protein [Laetiporus sulphureus 93-53]KZT03139.1 delta 9-fatty acid desaturase protein [Laetiporus sulphureus 93-53]
MTGYLTASAPILSPFMHLFTSLFGFEKIPPIRGIQWFNLSVLVFTPALAAYGICYVPINSKTMVCAVTLYVNSMIGITAGYHRLWSHRAYKATLALQCFLLLSGSCAVQGSVYWWARRHRSHHRHTDTDEDPYNAKRGLFWSHIGWMIFHTDLRPGSADISDLRNDELIQWQHRWYFAIAFTTGFVLPTMLTGFLWDDWLGGLCFAAALRMTVCHHCVFCINSVAHYLGDTPYDDRLSPKDHLLSAILTMGEGYHNFHHQFPMDYRNAFRWYQYDPTKWFITACNVIGLASHLRTFPGNEIQKGSLTMELKRLKRLQDALEWPVPPEDLPILTWSAFQEEAAKRTLILVSGFIHDVTTFNAEHPGGVELLRRNSGKDMTAAFFGGIYQHSNAAHNFLAMLRVGILAGGVELLGEQHIPPSQQLHITSNLRA